MVWFIITVQITGHLSMKISRIFTMSGGIALIVPLTSTRKTYAWLESHRSEKILKSSSHKA